METLDLRENKIKNVSDRLNDLAELQDLMLEGNQIEYISPAIGKLSKLDYISLSRNRIRNLPKEFYDMTNLDFIHLHNNQIESLSPHIQNLWKLNYISIANNKITELPNEFYNLPKLQFITIEGNSLSFDFLKLKNKEGFVSISLSEYQFENKAISLREFKSLAEILIFIKNYEFGVGMIERFKPYFTDFQGNLLPRIER